MGVQRGMTWSRWFILAGVWLALYDDLFERFPEAPLWQLREQQTEGLHIAASRSDHRMGDDRIHGSPVVPLAGMFGEGRSPPECEICHGRLPPQKSPVRLRRCYCRPPHWLRCTLWTTSMAGASIN